MNHSETVAKGVVESVIPGARMVFRLDQCRSVHDFDLFLPSGMIAAAEATAAVDESEARINGAIESRRKGGSAIKARLCKKDWHIDPDEGANINLIREGIDAQLAALESQGISEFGPLDGWSNPVASVIYHDLRVFSGHVTQWKEPGYIRMARVPSRGGFSGPSLLLEAVEREAIRADNRKKLAAAQTSERHMLVYVDSNNFLPWRSFWHFEPPSVLPQLSPEITDVWAFTETVGAANHCTVWRASVTSPWHSLGHVNLNG
jgi:hypothetical protein